MQRDTSSIPGLGRFHMPQGNLAHVLQPLKPTHPRACAPTWSARKLSCSVPPETTIFRSFGFPTNACSSLNHILQVISSCWAPGTCATKSYILRLPPSLKAALPRSGVQITPSHQQQNILHIVDQMEPSKFDPSKSIDQNYL